MKISSLVLPSIALGAATLLVIPGSNSNAFTRDGSSLNLGQRDFRVRNNFLDSATNNNTTPDPMFPGGTGVFLATWKGAGEWGSDPHGDGTGDPTQSVIGSGGANFDAFWAGKSTGVGGTNDNVIGATSGCGNGVLAFAELPSSNGWRIRFCDDAFVFSDGPGSVPGSQFDYQSILCHEYGHVLGLGHSATGSATMFASIGPGSTAPRSIAPDDIAGVQAIYGVKSSSKPFICSTDATGGTTLTIIGDKFDATGNQVWFTRAASSAPNASPFVIVNNVASTASGTRIDVTIPGAAGPGDVAVRKAGSSGSHRLLTNCFPTNLTGLIEVTCPFQLNSVSPTTAFALMPGTAQFMTLSGVGLNGVTSIKLEPNTTIPSSDWTIVSASTITVNLPPAPSLGPNTITVTTPAGSSSINFNVVLGATPVLEIGNGDPANVIANGDTFTATLSGSVGSVQRIFYSPSNVPSSVPAASFLIGNNFSELFTGPDVVIGANGIGSLSMPLSYTNPAAVFFVQSLDLTGGVPFAISNLQSVTLAP